MESIIIQKYQKVYGKILTKMLINLYKHWNNAKVKNKTFVLEQKSDINE